jgi:peptide/nickel transport system permease protein
MRAYIIRRLLLAIPNILIVSFLIFTVVHFLPGDIIDSLLASVGPEGGGLERERWERILGLDASLFVQYGRWMGFLPRPEQGFSGILQGQFGDSWWRGMPVLNLVAGRWPVTLQLGLMGIIISQIIALSVGIYSALRQDTIGDYVSRSFALFCISVPDFWLGTLLVIFPAIWWGYMPPMSVTPFFENPIGNLKQFIAPALVLGMVLSGTITRMTRTMMLEVLRQDYIRTAWAKGLRERTVILRHALKNALIPVISIAGIHLQIMVGGMVIIEKIFMLPGIGRLLVDAITQRDQPLITGITLFFAVGLIVINLLVDLTYAFLDPRVHF